MTFRSRLLASLPPVLLLVVLLVPLAFAGHSPSSDLKLGRAKLEHVTVDQGSIKRRSVAIENGGAAAVLVTRVSVKGDPLAVKLVREKVVVEVALGAEFQYELPPNENAQLEIAFDAKDQPLGEKSATILVEAGGTTLELPVAWEVVEPKRSGEAERPIEKPRTDLAKYVSKGPPPVLECDRYMEDFGKVLSGEKLTTKFKLRNTGEGDLVLIKIGAQCHCTLPKLTLPGGEVSGKQIAKEEVYGTLKKGEEAELEVVVDTVGLGGATTKKIEINTNDAVRSPMSLRLHMVVDNPFVFSPSSLDFGAVRRGERVTRTVRMVSRDLGKFVITGYEMKQPEPFDVEYQEVKAKKDEQCAWELKLTSREGLPCQEHLGRLKLEIEHERIHSLDTLQYTLRVVPDVQWTYAGANRPSPESVTLGLVKPGTNDEQKFVFENKNPGVPYVPKEAKVVSKVGAEAFTTEIVELEKGVRYELKLKMPSASMRLFKGEIRILADHATLPELKIGFTGQWMGPLPSPAPAQKPANQESGK